MSPWLCRSVLECASCRRCEKGCAVYQSFGALSEEKRRRCRLVLVGEWKGNLVTRLYRQGAVSRCHLDVSRCSRIDDGNLLVASEQKPKLSPNILGVWPRSCMRRIRTVSELVSLQTIHVFQLTKTAYTCFPSRLVLFLVFLLPAPLHPRYTTPLETAKRPSREFIMDTKSATMRRSHRKSRNGCSQCKTRHIKVVTIKHIGSKGTYIQSAMRQNRNVETANVWT
jgi:hypothetical protein